ncbi:hypothetical protein ABH920_008154 [Catenulispora sp. EB89]|uniref:hypothetical protein n=1 Tax=Catenulispora sp. EB89 TaxID=3156257 RepID=UPI003516A277
MTLTLDGPDGACPLCQNPMNHAVGESLSGGENSWFLEALCRVCDHSSLQQGRRFVPTHWRDLFLELTGQWRIRIDQSSDAGVLVMRALRRVFRLPLARTREIHGQLLHAGWPGTRGEIAWLAVELGELGVATTVDVEVPGTQTELPERRMPLPPSRIGGAGDSDGATVSIADGPERSRVADYLATSPCLVAGGYWIDPVTRDPRHRGGDGFRSDGTYIWSTAWATLLARHGLPLDADFVDHVRERGYQPPRIEGSALDALLVATGLEPPDYPDEPDEL